MLRDYCFEFNAKWRLGHVEIRSVVVDIVVTVGEHLIVVSVPDG